MANNKFLCGVVALVLTLSGTTAAAGSAEDWYMSDYVPLWKENAWDKLDEIAAFYAESIQSHPADGDVTSENSRAWLGAGLELWKSQGWIGSDVTALQVDELNASTVAFKAKWRDWYADGSEEFSCGWYMADKQGDDWQFTQYADLDCAAHGL